MVGTMTSSSQPTGSASTGERWVRTDTSLFITFALGMLLESYIFTLAPVATAWVKEPVSLRSLLLSWAPLWLIIGIAIAGPVGDWIGRRSTFYLTMTAYGIGGIGLIFSDSYVLILVFLAILLAAAGAEMNMIMVQVHETMPTKHRSKAAMLAVNCINLGDVVIAAVDLSSRSSGVDFQRGMVAATILFVLVILLFFRRQTPESIRWLVRKGRTEQALAELARFYGPEEALARRRAVEDAKARAKVAVVGRPIRRYPALWLRITALTLVAFAGTTGFGLLTYTLGPIHFPKLTADIILVTGIVAFTSGFIGLWADLLSRKNLLLIGYLGAVAFTAVAWATESTWAKTLVLFWILLVFLNVFTNLGYLVEDTLKGEVWPTRYRARFTGLIRFISIGGYIGTIYWTEHFTTKALIAFNLGVWILGLLGALLWFFGGIETGKGVDIESASGDSGGTELLELPIERLVADRAPISQ